MNVIKARAVARATEKFDRERDRAKIQVMLSAVALLVMLMILVSSGCSHAQVMADEEAIHGALVRVEESVNWVEANPETVKILLDEAAKASTDPTYQKIIDKARTGAASGDLATVQKIVSGGIALTGPVTPNSIPTPSETGH